MNDDNPLEETLRDVALFLRQQAEIFGDQMYISQEPAPSESSPALHVVDKFENQQPDKNVPPSDGEELKQKQKTINIAEERDLFEGKVVNPAWKIAPDWAESDSLEKLKTSISGCLRCRLGAARKNFVFGVGNPRAKLVLIGEAPGADEDEQGEPFVGRAGQLLNKILAAVQLKREDVYICNILKCRPPNNRDPLPDEVDSCEPFLKKQIEILNPKLILCLGRIAGQTLLKTNATLTDLRKNVYQYQGVKVLVTFHPAALLRNPNWKRPAWEDVQKMKKMYDELPD